MKRDLLILALLLLPLLLQAQTADKPSWSEDLPEKTEAPDMEVLKETRKKIELDLDMSDFGDREQRGDIFAEEDSQNQPAEETQQSETAKQSAALAAQKKQAEEKARQQQLEAQRREQERLAAEAEARRQEQLRQEAERREKERLAAEAEARRQEQLRQEAQRREQERLAAEAEKQRQQQAEQAALEARRRELQAAEEVERQRLLPQQPATPAEASGNTQSASSTPKAYQWTFVHKVAPDYPVKAYRERKEGWVDVDVTINPDGTVQQADVVKIYRNQRIFAKPALKAVQQWRFEPPQNYGISEPLTRRYRVEFKLQDEAAVRSGGKPAVISGV